MSCPNRQIFARFKLCASIPSSGKAVLTFNVDGKAEHREEVGRGLLEARDALTPQEY